MKTTNALIIIAKYPEHGQVKTRLRGHMPDDKILELYTNLLKTSIQKLRFIPGVDTFIAFAPAGSESYFANFNLGLIPLTDGGLGERMFMAFQDVFLKGYKNAVLVGADIPGLSSKIILHAFEILSDHDLAYGPAADGGYYLVGMRKLIKDVFKEVPWSSALTLKKSIEQAEQAGYTIGFSNTLSDIDTIDDVKRAGLYNV